MDLKNELKAYIKDILSNYVKIHVAAGDPGVNDDDSNTGGNGIFKAGDVWINSGDDGYFVCISAATGAANWDEMAKV